MERVGCLSQGTEEARGAEWEGGSRSDGALGPGGLRAWRGRGTSGKLHRGPLAPKTKITELGVREGSRQEDLPLCIAGGQSSWPTCKGSVQVGGMGLRQWT